MTATVESVPVPGTVVYSCDACRLATIVRLHPAEAAAAKYLHGLCGDPACRCRWHTKREYVDADGRAHKTNAIRRGGGRAI